MAREETVTMPTFMLAVALLCGKVPLLYLGAENRRSVQYCLGLSYSRLGETALRPEGH